MDKKIILALAGSGKTHYISNSFDPKESVYFISFTHRNVDNIRLAVRERFNGEIPRNIMITTFDSFVYNQLIKPIEILLKPLGVKINGVEVNYSPIHDCRDPRYVKIDKMDHYLTKDRKIYVSRMSKLIVKQSRDIKDILLKRLKKYCNIIYFDEFQDYNGYDFNVIEWIMNEYEGHVVAVGDIYQSLVAPVRRDGGTNSFKPFSDIRNCDDVKLKTKLKNNIEVVKDTMYGSRRVSENVARFIRESMGIPILGHNGEGSVIEIESMSEIDAIMTDPTIKKLVWNKSVVSDKMTDYINWSYSKGDTYKDSCVILTSNTNNIGSWKSLEINVRNKLYVALTRSKRNVYLVHIEDFKRWKESK